MLDDLISLHGREANAVRRSLMNQVNFGRDDAEVQRVLDGRDPTALRERGVLIGSANAVIEQLGAFAEAGVQRIMLQWMALDDLDRLEAMAVQVLPHFHR
jgi:alkanesulfonate monooxygenase SsuD/methylene tetrahydromethanopterin reductase-like flavin-dependent oxidoreductase (luciferase family)